LLWLPVSDRRWLFFETKVYRKYARKVEKSRVAYMIAYLGSVDVKFSTSADASHHGYALNQLVVRLLFAITTDGGYSDSEEFNLFQVRDCRRLEKQARRQLASPPATTRRIPTMTTLTPAAVFRSLGPDC
ncbi:hypothetical protein PSPO01_16429, partial [Paraphaeosphaeria sporulosa]